MDLLTFAGNILLAALLGTLLGLERHFRRHPAGMRTNALVSTGAAMFVTLTSLLNDSTSPSRIASYIVSGVGFLGGGVILKEGTNVRGLTTAAGLWCSAAVGTMAGIGAGWHAIVGSGFVLAIVLGLRPLSNWMDARRDRLVTSSQNYRLRVTCQERDLANVRTVLARHLADAPGVVLLGVAIGKPKRKKQVILRADVVATPANDRAIQDTVSRLLIDPDVRSASWEKTEAPAE